VSLASARPSGGASVLKLGIDSRNAHTRTNFTWRCSRWDVGAFEPSPRVNARYAIEIDGCVNRKNERQRPVALMKAERSRLDSHARACLALCDHAETANSRRNAGSGHRFLSDPLTTGIVQGLELWRFPRTRQPVNFLTTIVTERGRDREVNVDRRGPHVARHASREIFEGCSEQPGESSVVPEASGEIFGLMTGDVRPNAIRTNHLVWDFRSPREVRARRCTRRLEVGPEWTDHPHLNNRETNRNIVQCHRQTWLRLFSCRW
jgi:hypothetical protein